MVVRLFRPINSPAAHAIVGLAYSLPAHKLHPPFSARAAHHIRPDDCTLAVEACLAWSLVDCSDLNEIASLAPSVNDVWALGLRIVFGKSSTLAANQATCDLVAA